MGKSILNDFCDFAKSADLNIFREIYGNRLGNHFWDKHVTSQNRNMTWTYNDMDSQNRLKLIDYLNSGR